MVNDRRPALLCVPFAGAGASFFHPWQRAAGDRWRVVAVEPAGRERRLADAPHRDVGDAVTDVVDGLAEVLRSAPHTVLFGHSLGAVVAYELAHAFAARDVRVDRLIVSGSPGPWSQRERRATGLPENEFLARVEEFAGFRHPALEHPEMRDMIVPVLRADCEMHENYLPSTDTPLAVPITSLRGRDDGLASPDEAREWRAATSGPFRFLEVPGNHMYLVDRAEDVLRIIDAECAQTSDR
ncbi:thioesterase [Pseudonocardia sp. AL041005-10]|nr:alpha/beta fold hydrolase [Pseudonocardia sp. AL041005-10]ALE77169.1 thioesterase [Pseudonocardia sp. AL041005-10]